MKNILFLNKDGFLGGSAVSLLLLLKNIRKEFNIYVILGNNGILQQEIKKLNIPVKIIKFHHWRKLNNIFKNFYTIFKLKIFIIKNKFDIIHSNSYEINPFMVLSAPQKIKTICHVRDIINKNRAKKYLLQKTNIIIAVANAVKKPIKNVNNNIQVIYNGVDLKKAEQSKSHTPSNIKIKKSNFKVGIIGNCEERKRQEDFIKAGIKVLKENKNFRFLIIGNNKTEYCKKISLLTNKYKSYFHFIGHVYNIFTIIKALDIVIITSKSEALPRAAIESMACKKPVIATKVGGIPEIIIHNKTGFLFQVGNYKKLANYILLFYQNKKMLKKYGIEGQKRIKKLFNSATYINSIKSIYSPKSGCVHYEK